MELAAAFFISVPELSAQAVIVCVTSRHRLCHISDIIFAGAEQPNMNDLTDLTHLTSSSDLDGGSGRPVVVPKSDARTVFGRVRSIIFITASVTATVGWL